MTSTIRRNQAVAATSKMTIDYSGTVQAAAAYLLRYGLVLVIVWIGFMKFTAYEAAGIQPLVANSPLMSWVYAIFGARAFSAMLGIVEVAVAAMIALRPVSARVAAIGSGLAAVTLTFILSTPG
jgi:reactive chlorine resistance protein C